MYLADYHIHSNYCDGTESLETLLKAALKKHMSDIGVLYHSPTDFDKSYCIKEESVSKFFEEMNSLKEKYKGELRVFSGVEQDLFSSKPPKEADYIIGSCHYIKIEGEYVPVDESFEIIKEAAENYFGGDFNKLAEVYYNQEARVAKETNCRIVGHFDLISKFNDRYNFYSEESKTLKSFAYMAAEELLKDCNLFELNTGAVFRGYKQRPYPSDFILKYLKEKNADIILSGDAHSAEALCFGFKEAEEYLKSLGFKYRAVLTETGYRGIML